jgi:hypothetical protein
MFALDKSNFDFPGTAATRKAIQTHFPGAMSGVDTEELIAMKL